MHYTLIILQEGAAVASTSEPPGESEGEGESNRSDRQQYNRYVVRELVLEVISYYTGGTTCRWMRIRERQGTL